MHKNMTKRTQHMRTGRRAKSSRQSSRNKLNCWEPAYVVELSFFLFPSLLCPLWKAHLCFCFSLSLSSGPSSALVPPIVPTAYWGFQAFPPLVFDVPSLISSVVGLHRHFATLVVPSARHGAQEAKGTTWGGCWEPTQTHKDPNSNAANTCLCALLPINLDCSWFSQHLSIAILQCTLRMLSASQKQGVVLHAVYARWLMVTSWGHKGPFASEVIAQVLLSKSYRWGHLIGICVTAGFILKTCCIPWTHYDY